MSAAGQALRKGWCPGALRPMMARDGLLVRLRITGGILSSATAAALADLTEAHGNGLVDLSARGNLQMRGVAEAALPALHEALASLGLLDADASGEAVRNVIASPLAGLGPAVDIRPMTVALEAALVESPALQALPGKFGFLIDDGGAPSLACVAADVRLDWNATNGTFSIGLGGDAAHATRIGVCAAGDLVACATMIGIAAAALFGRLPEARRMRDLIAGFGADAVARACDGALRPSSGGPSPHPQLVGLRTFAGVSTLGLAAPFGRLDSRMLHLAAALAHRQVAPQGLRLTPWRTLLVPGAQTIDPGIVEAGFIVDPGDPRLAVAACVGASGCERGTTDTQADATELSALAPQPGRETTLHVSGCAKGCAKPAASAVTLVGRDGRYDLVRDGRAGDSPSLVGLDLDGVRSALADLRIPA